MNPNKGEQGEGGNKEEVLIGAEPFRHLPGYTGNDHTLQCNNRTDETKGDLGKGNEPVIFTVHSDEHTDNTIHSGRSENDDQSKGGAAYPLGHFPCLPESGSNRWPMGGGAIVFCFL